MIDLWEVLQWKHLAVQALVFQSEEEVASLSMGGMCHLPPRNCDVPSETNVPNIPQEREHECK